MSEHHSAYCEILGEDLCAKCISSREPNSDDFSKDWRLLSCVNYSDYYRDLSSREHALIAMARFPSYHSFAASLLMPDAHQSGIIDLIQSSRYYRNRRHEIRDENEAIREETTASTLPKLSHSTSLVTSREVVWQPPRSAYNTRASSKEDLGLKYQRELDVVALADRLSSLYRLKYVLSSNKSRASSLTSGTVSELAFSKNTTPDLLELEKVLSSVKMENETKLSSCNEFLEEDGQVESILKKLLEQCTMQDYRELRILPPIVDQNDKSVLPKRHAIVDMENYNGIQSET